MVINSSKLSNTLKSILNILRTLAPSQKSYPLLKQESSVGNNRDTRGQGSLNNPPYLTIDQTYKLWLSYCRKEKALGHYNFMKYGEYLEKVITKEYLIY